MEQRILVDFKSKISAVRKVIYASALIMLIKFGAYYLSGSDAVLSDALESLINIATSSFTLYSLYYSSKLRDEDHPYGHGKIEYFAIGFEGALILGTGLFIIIHSAEKLIAPEALRDVDGGIILTAISGLFMYMIGSFLKKKGREMNSLPLIADGEHFHVDTITSVGLIVGLVLYRVTGLYWIDPVLAMLLALHIMMSGYKLVREAVNHLLDKADVDSISKLTGFLQENRRETWIDVHNLRLQKFGAYFHVDCHLTLPSNLSLEQAHEEVKIFEQEVNRCYDQSVEVFVHTDPCMQLPCSLCNLQHCQIRKAAFEKSVNWSSELLMANKKHTL